MNGVVVLLVQIGALCLETQHPCGFRVTLPHQTTIALPGRTPTRYICAPIRRSPVMPSFALRFVGQEALPSRLSEFDREQFFELTPADVASIREQFHNDHRLPAALMVMFMRVAGRPLDGFNVLPRNLLKYTAGMVGVPPPSIAALRSIYKRSQTLFKHQLWAKTYLGLRDLEQADKVLLTDALRVHAQEASHLAGC